MKINFEKIVYVLVYMPIAFLAMMITDLIFYFYHKLCNGWQRKF